jgi:transposase-like protein
MNQKSAWFMQQRIRAAMLTSEGELLQGIVEADETYVGGKAKNRKAKQRRVRLGQKSLGPVAGKQAIVSLVQRGGNVRSFHVANVTGATLRSILVTNVDRASTLMTDEHSGYKLLGQEFAEHGVVVHSKGEYGRGTVHTNTIEGFFSLLKRGIIGSYHHVSEQHLRRYCAEFDMRYNTRDISDGERAAEILKGGIGKRLTYRRTGLLAA